MTLAPVADVNTRAENPVIGTRSFGTDPALVATHVAAWTEGLQEPGVAACVKHWPGHGDTDLDSHLALPRVDAGRRRPRGARAGAVRRRGQGRRRGGDDLARRGLRLGPGLPATLSPAALAPAARRPRASRASSSATHSTWPGRPRAAGSRRRRSSRSPPAATCSASARAPGPTTPTSRWSALSKRRSWPRSARAGSSEERLAEAVARVAALPRPASGLASDLDPGMLPRGRGPRRSPSRAACPTCAARSVVRVDSPGTIAVGDVPWGLPVDAPYDALPDGPLVVQVRDAHRQPRGRGCAGSGRRPRRGGGRRVGLAGPGHDDLPRICARGWSQPGRDAVADVLRAAGWDR